MLGETVMKSTWLALTRASSSPAVHLLLLCSAGLSACDGSSAPDATSGAGGEAEESTRGSDTAWLASLGGSSAEASGGGPGSTQLAESIWSALDCPPEQWVCPAKHPCAGWSSEPSDCYCDANAPLEPGDCGADEDFSCTTAEYDFSTGRELDPPVRWACQCEPRTEACCDSARWTHTYGVIPLSGCVDEPGPREVVCDCTSYLR